MSCATVVIVACYWLFIGIETADLIAIDIVSAAAGSLHAIVSSTAVIAIASILSSSYAVVTLCSFISPTDDGTTNSRRHLLSFDQLYRVIVGAVGILFAEIPLVSVRSQIIAAYHQSSTFRQLPAVFCIWLVKDVAFIIIAVVMVVMYMVKARRKTGAGGSSCGRMAFDNPDVFFAPEKRDTYIAQRHGLTAPGVPRLTAPAVPQDPATESSALMDETKTKTPSSTSKAGAKKSKKCVTFRLDVNEGGSSKHVSEDCRPADDDDDDDDDVDVADSRV